MGRVECCLQPHGSSKRFAGCVIVPYACWIQQFMPQTVVNNIIMRIKPAESSLSQSCELHRRHHGTCCRSGTCYVMASCSRIATLTQLSELHYAARMYAT